MLVTLTPMPYCWRERESDCNVCRVDEYHTDTFSCDRGSRDQHVRRPDRRKHSTRRPADHHPSVNHNNNKPGAPLKMEQVDHVNKLLDCMRLHCKSRTNEKGRQEGFGHEGGLQEGRKEACSET